MSVNHLYFSNVTNSVTEASLTEELKEKWPEVFIEPANQGELVVKVFRDGHVASAVVYNLDLDFEKLSIEAEETKLLGRAIRVKPDTGELRDPITGKFLDAMTGVDHRIKVSAYGETSRKLNKVFTTEFLRDISYYGLNLQSKFLHLKPHRDLTYQYLSTPGHVVNTVQQQGPPNLIKVEYGSILGAIQAVSLLNHRPLTQTHRIQLWNVSGTFQCNSIKAVGIGNPDEEQATFPFVLDIDQYQKTFRYIPFSHMNPIILDPNILSSQVQSQCWRCKKSFRLLGIDRRLGYIAGKCECIYDSTIAVSKNNAYQWQYDLGFTRLAEGHASNGSTITELVIWHEPMKDLFINLLDYGRVVLPLLEEEWKVSRSIFKETYSCEGEILEQNFVEEMTTKPMDVFGIKIKVPKTKLWTIETRTSVKHATLQLELRNKYGDKQSDEVKARVWWIEEIDDNTLVLSTSLKCRRKWKPVVHSAVNIIPKQDKIFYQAQRQLLNKLMKCHVESRIHLLLQGPVSEGHKIELIGLWDQFKELNTFQANRTSIEQDDDLNQEEQEEMNVNVQLLYGEEDKDQHNEVKVTDSVILNHPLFLVFLRCQPNNRNVWSIPSNRIPANPNYQTRFDKMITSVRSKLNEKQLLGCDIATASSVSVVQGPPGCGKTYMVSNYTVERYLQDAGTIILCAPSNEAVDNLAEAVTNRFRENSLPISLIRILSKSKELWTDDTWEIGLDGIAAGDKFPYLHKLVKNHPEFDATTIQDVISVLRNKNDHRLTCNQKKRWQGHVGKIEKEVLSRFRIILCTVATAMDTRLYAYTNKRLVSTLILEEAGQMTHPDTISITRFNPARVVLVGDHNQLPATINSQSADRSGLGRSQLELSSIATVADRSSILRQLVPWTTLDIQFRMEPAISKIVSELTYRGLLKNGLNIGTRPSVLPGNFDHDFAENSRSAVVFYDKRGKETTVGTSYSNVPEASEVCAIVGRILKLNVNPQHVVILTLYEAQRVEMIRQLNNRKQFLPYNSVRVMTVDSFQGREAPIVILSLVRSNSKHVVGFLNNPNRVNVAISRAMNYLFFVGDKSTFDGFNSGLWKNLMLLISRHGIVVKR